jgi:hypothetical protein
MFYGYLVYFSCVGILLCQEKSGNPVWRAEKIIRMKTKESWKIVLGPNVAFCIRRSGDCVIVTSKWLHIGRYNVALSISLACSSKKNHQCLDFQ